MKELNLSYVQYCTERVDLWRSVTLERLIAKYLVTTKLVTEDLKDVVTSEHYVYCYRIGAYHCLRGIEGADLINHLSFCPCLCSSAQNYYIKLSKKNLRYMGFKTLDYLRQIHCSLISAKNMQWFEKKRFRMKPTDIGYATLKAHNGE